jgi:hypothetical protein
MAFLGNIERLLPEGQFVATYKWLGSWLNKLQERVHRNVAVVAVANKIARIAWAVLARHDIYRPSAAAAA